MDTIKNIGTILGIITALASIIGLLWKLFKAIDKVNNKIDRLEKDIAELQRDRLDEAHELYMARGWISASKKRSLSDWYTRYTQSGHNHLTKHYIEDLESLPVKNPNEE